MLRQQTFFFNIYESKFSIYDIYTTGEAQLSRDIQNEACYTSLTLFCLKEIEFG